MSRRVIIDELEFEVPYGKLAAKTWHEETEDSKRVLMLHGWMDNAGSFDNIVPYLKHKDGLYIVALDLPGHGKSSQLPPGSSYSDLNIVMEVRRCLMDMQWVQSTTKKGNGTSNSIAPVTHRQFTIVGHSLGAGLAIFYASLFPDDIEQLVLLDFIKAKTYPLDRFLDETARTIDQFIETVPSQSPFSSPVLSKANPLNNPNKTVDKGQVVVSQEAAIIATIEAHRQLGILTRDDATCLLKRSTVAVSTPPNCVIYSRDLRLQAMLNFRENLDIHKVMFGRCLSHILIILGKTGMYSEAGDFTNQMGELEEFYRKRAKSVHLQWIDADHYLHMNRAQETAEMINRYLEAPAEYKIVP